jgi:methylated-DNA-[protein]-cysteine S-methyltransferase
VSSRVAYSIARTELGSFLVAARSGRLCFLDLAGERGLARLERTAYARFGAATSALGETALAHADVELAPIVDALVEYAAGSLREFDLELDLAGSDFERRVWAELRRIPYGETRTYGEIAASLGDPGAARAVGRANGRNPVPIVVPCHRVVASDGIGGFTGGLEHKLRLLEHERRHAPSGQGLLGFA